MFPEYDRPKQYQDRKEPFANQKTNGYRLGDKVSDLTLSPDYAQIEAEERAKRASQADNEFEDKNSLRELLISLMKNIFG